MEHLFHFGACGKNTAMIIGAVVLAGGRSRRMGRPKESLPFANTTMLGHTVDTLLACAFPVIVVARDEAQELPPLDLEVDLVFDDRIDEGPLMGMLAGMRAAADDCDAVFVTGCDAPLLRPEAIDWLARHLGEHDLVMTKIDGFVQPLGAIYRTSILPVIDDLVAAGVRTPRTLAKRENVRILTEAEVDAFDPDRGFLRNVNCPEDYAAVQKGDAST